MPINRPNLNLNIPPLNIVAAYDGAEIPSTNKHLKNNFNSLHNQMRKMPVSHFKEALDVPDYSGMRQSGFFAMSQGFQLNNHGYDVFIHARRESPQSQGKFAGDKFHISVLRDMVPQAFQALSGLLFSEDSPVDKWKVTDMEKVVQQARVSLGAQYKTRPGKFAVQCVVSPQDTAIYRVSGIQTIRKWGYFRTVS